MYCRSESITTQRREPGTRLLAMYCRSESITTQRREPGTEANMYVQYNISPQPLTHPLLFLLDSQLPPQSLHQGLQAAGWSLLGGLLSRRQFSLQHLQLLFQLRHLSGALLHGRLELCEGVRVCASVRVYSIQVQTDKS